MQDIFRSQFRLPQELADKLREAAEGSGRSMNAEVVARLQDSFDDVPAFETALRQQKAQLVYLKDERNTLVLLLSAVNPNTAPSEDFRMLQRRLAELDLSIANTEKRIKQFTNHTG